MTYYEENKSLKHWIQNKLYTVTNKLYNKRCNINWFKENGFEKQWYEIMKLTNFLPKDTRFSERNYCIQNDITEVQTCSVCDNPVKYTTCLDVGYRKYCSNRCTQLAPETRKKFKKLNQEKYGVDHHLSSNLIKQRTKQTLLKQYGVDNISKVPEIKQKKIDTCMKNHGVSHGWNSENQKLALLKKYGVDNVAKVPEIILKRQASRNNMTIEDYKSHLINLPDRKKYYRAVAKITHQQPIHLLEHYDKRGVASVEGAYQLDHKYSIYRGFIEGIDPEIIGDIKNLEFISAILNNSKGSKCSIDIEEINGDN